MRLTNEQISIIKQTAEVFLGPDAQVIVFGSRTDGLRRGGDIDLLFETGRRLDDRATTLGNIYVRLIRHLGDRKIDVLLKDANTPEAPVLLAARKTGVVL